MSSNVFRLLIILAIMELNSRIASLIIEAKGGNHLST
jgi:hypothetical protein